MLFISWGLKLISLQAKTNIKAEENPEFA